MEKLMKNNVMKLIVCTGFFCGTIFGMEKEQVLSHEVQKQFYVEYEDRHIGEYYDPCTKSYSWVNNYILKRRKIDELGVQRVFDKLEHTNVASAKRFSGSLVLRNQKYYVKGEVDYISSVNTKKQNFLEPDCIPIECTAIQLREAIRLMDQQKCVFVFDEYGHRLDIQDVSPEVKSILENLFLTI
jgi:hypothetical protein